MNKAELLSEIRSQSATGTISRADVVHAFDEGSAKGGHALGRSASLPDVLTFLGGAIVLIGISVLVWQNWTSFNQVTKVLVTLGSAIAAYAVGALFDKRDKLEVVSQAFFLISAILLPGGLYVLIDVLQVQFSSIGLQLFVSSACFLVFFGSFFGFKRPIFVIFSVAYGTWLFFAVTDYIVGPGSFLYDNQFYEYRALLVGLSYLLMAHAFQKTTLSSLSSWMYSFGIIVFLGAALALGGWSPDQHLVWELIFPILTFGSIYLSVLLKTKSLLFFGAAYLMAYILKITAEYFSQSFGWPLALVVCGFMLMGVGYASYSVGRKYIA